MMTARTVPRLKKTKVWVILARYFVPIDCEAIRLSELQESGGRAIVTHVEDTLNEQDTEEDEVSLPCVRDEGFSLSFSRKRDLISESVSTTETNESMREDSQLRESFEPNRKRLKLHQRLVPSS